MMILKNALLQTVSWGLYRNSHKQQQQLQQQLRQQQEEKEEEETLAEVAASGRAQSWRQLSYGH